MEADLYELRMSDGTFSTCILKNKLDDILLEIRNKIDRDMTDEGSKQSFLYEIGIRKL